MSNANIAFLTGLLNGGLDQYKLNRTWKREDDNAPEQATTAPVAQSRLPSYTLPLGLIISRQEANLESIDQYETGGVSHSFTAHGITALN